MENAGVKEKKYVVGEVITGSAPVGGTTANGKFPGARCWQKANSSKSSATTTPPPPMPNIPEATPHTHATTNIPARRAIESDTNFLPIAAGYVRVARRFSPKQERRQHQETSKPSF